MKSALKKLLLLLFLAGPCGLYAQQESQVIDKVHKSIREGNSTSLSSMFHTTVDLELGDTDGNFSDNQAEMIIKDFFAKNPVKSYTIKHQGSSDDGSKYSIGLYQSTGNRKYRVYILLKKQDAGLRINQLQFEEE